MPYRLEDGESLVDGIRRIAREQADTAVEILESGLDPDEAIHEARKIFKKIRAVLRLVRDEIGEETFDCENVYYRDVGRQLAAVRDARVAIDTLADMGEGHRSVSANEAFRALEERLRERYERIRQRDFEERGVRGRVAEAVRSARPRIEAWPLDGEGFELIRPSLARVYRRGRRRMARAYDEPSFECFHEWRKRVKYLWYHVRILQPVWTGVMDETADEIHQVADLIGDSNDLAELVRLVERESDLLLDADAREVLLELVAERRRSLQSRARPLGERIWFESRDDFVDRIGAYWKAWRRAHPVS